MRDPKRIDRIINLLHAYWSQQPDLRLGQILGNAVSTFNGRNDLSYYLEDDKFEDWLRKQLDLLTQLAVEAKNNDVEKL